MIELNWKIDNVGYTKSVCENESSYRYRSLMEKPTLVLKFSLAEYVEFPIGTQCVFQNESYSLLSPATIKKNGVRDIEYTLTMGTDQEHLSRYKLRNNEDGRLKWSMTAKPAEFLRQIVLNLNARDGEDVWAVGSCIESTEKTIEFNHSYLLDALASVADTFETEWEIVGHTINLKKVEYFKTDPLALSYGKGNGFIPGLGRSSSSDSTPVEVLYVQGGSDNIDSSTYGNANLLLPKSQEYTYEGRKYKTSADGLSIQRADKTPLYNNEDSLDLSEIYPKRVGTVTSVEVVSEEKNFYDVLDNTIPSSLNYNDYLIAGESMTIIFQSGMLAGREFEIKYKHTDRRFEIVPQEYDGVTMPSATFKPAVDDTYAIFGCSLPSDYICNNVSQIGASWDMFKEACRYLYENEDQKFTFSGELQGIWAKNHWGEVGGRLCVGGYVHFSDTQFAPEGTDIRITGIKDYLYNPYSPTIELSNEVSGTSVSSSLKTISQQEVLIEESHTNALNFTKRRFRDAKESLEMLSDAMLNFSDGITPISVQTMAMLVGDESLQFVFMNAEGSTVSFLPTYDAEAKQLSCEHTYLKHMTLGISNISSSHSNDEYKVWEVGEYISPVLTDGSKKYYLYAKCPTNTSVKASFLLSETAKDMTAESGFYYFLVGILNSEYDSSRSYVSLYGYTEILPARITTDKIVSSDGKSYMDLAQNGLRLESADGDTYLDWNGEEDGTLVLNNAKIKNALKVIGEAAIAGFKFTDDIIKSASEITTGTPAFYLDGKNGKLVLRSSSSGDRTWYNQGLKDSQVSINSQNGLIECTNDDGGSLISASGVFSNNPMVQPLSSATGSKLRCCIGANGYAKNVSSSDADCVIGVFGAAENTGDTPAYGGYFFDLNASGLVLNTKVSSNTSVTLTKNYTQVLANNTAGNAAKVYLPSDCLSGQVIWFYQNGSGGSTIYPPSGQTMYAGGSSVSSIGLYYGYEAKFTFVKIGSSGYWFASKWKT